MSITCRSRRLNSDSGFVVTLVSYVEKSTLLIFQHARPFVKPLLVFGAMSIAERRLANQRISTPADATPLEVVRWLTAVQAQDYAGALWAVGLRMANATAPLIQQAIADRLIVRTWPMRGTLHFVAATDARWLLALTARRPIAGRAQRQRWLGLDDRTVARAASLIARELEGGRHLPRKDLYAVLERGRITPDGQRGNHILWCLAVDGLICQAVPTRTQATFALLDEWAPHPPSSPDPESGLAELARRYFRSHGPATAHDFAWWAGLAVRDAKAASASILNDLAGQFVQESVDGRTYIGPADTATPKKAGLYLLPGFDEFILGYKDRGDTLAAGHARKVSGNNGVFRPTIVAGGRVIGTWRPFTPFRRLTSRETSAYRAALKRYERFINNTP
jgi:Winged helix DNA-binding domain